MNSVELCISLFGHIHTTVSRRSRRVSHTAETEICLAAIVVEINCKYLQRHSHFIAYLCSYISV